MGTIIVPTRIDNFERLTTPFQTFQFTLSPAYNNMDQALHNVVCYNYPKVTEVASDCKH